LELLAGAGDVSIMLGEILLLADVITQVIAVMSARLPL